MSVLVLNPNLLHWVEQGGTPVNLWRPPGHDARGGEPPEPYEKQPLAVSGSES